MLAGGGHARLRSRDGGEAEKMTYPKSVCMMAETFAEQGWPAEVDETGTGLMRWEDAEVVPLSSASSEC